MATTYSQAARIYRLSGKCGRVMSGKWELVELSLSSVKFMHDTGLCFSIIEARGRNLSSGTCMMFLSYRESSETKKTLNLWKPETSGSAFKTLLSHFEFLFIQKKTVKL
jgi:hypothetical protein